MYRIDVMSAHHEPIFQIVFFRAGRYSARDHHGHLVSKAGSAVSELRLCVVNAAPFESR